MDPDFLAPMIVMITLILTVGAVLLFRPLTKRLGALLELRVQQAKGEIENPQTERIEHLLESIASRLSLVEERVDFTDSLLESRRTEPRELPPTKEKSWE